MSTDKFILLTDHLSTGRSGMPSFLGSLTQLPTSKRLTINGFIPEAKIQKFKRGRRELKSTFNNSWQQTIELESKSCIRTFGQANRDHMGQDNPQSHRRVKQDGQFKRRSIIDLSYNPKQLLYRSVEDLGVDRNRRGLNYIAIKQINKPNPMFSGRQQPINTRRLYPKQRRKMRDEGEQCSRTFTWNTNKSKASSYATIHRIKLVK